MLLHGWIQVWTRGHNYNSEKESLKKKVQSMNIQVDNNKVLQISVSRRMEGLLEKKNWQSTMNSQFTKILRGMFVKYFHPWGKKTTSIVSWAYFIVKSTIILSKTHLD